MLTHRAKNLGVDPPKQRDEITLPPQGRPGYHSDLEHAGQLGECSLQACGGDVGVYRRFGATRYSRANYSVAPDGRFLMNIDAEKPVASPITVVLNWYEELKQRVSTR